MTAWPVIALGSAHFKALRALDEQALADLARQGSMAGPRPDGMFQALLERSSDAGLLFGVAGAGRCSANAYLAATQIENCLHIEEVAVAPLFRRQGLGTALIDAAKAECTKRSLSAITLTTDKFLPSNAEFYKALGFEVIEPACCPAYLLEIMAAEHEIFHDPSRRTTMIWHVGSAGPGRG